jgi:hypothetical protein
MSQDSEALVIPLSKGKIFLLTFGAVAFVALGVWLYLNADHISRGNPLYVRGVAAACVLFFGLCGAYASRKLFDSAPGLVIDTAGIVDNSSSISAGRIPWSDIEGFKVRTIKRQRFLTIEVRNPEKYLQRVSGLRRLLVAINARYFGSPIQITANTLAIGFDDLLKYITEARAKYGA